MGDVVTYEQVGAVATITLNRPDKLNAINWEVVNGLDAAFERAASDDEVKAVVLTGAGKAFCVGDDLNQAWSGEQFEALMKRFKEQPEEAESNRQFDFPKPVVVAVNGYCFGGALELVLWADILIASENAEFAAQFVKYGLTGGAVTFYRLPRLIGHSNASYMLLTGERIGAAEAKDLGLVSKVVSSAELMDEAMRIASTIASYPEDAVRNTREAMRISLRATREGQRDITVFSNQLLASLFERLGASASG